MQNTIKRSKFLSLILRHKPETVGITLDNAGWVKVSDLLSALNKTSNRMSLDELEEVVRDNNKKRFEFSPDKKRIRASQGHSLDVDLGYKAAVPPQNLYHGTANHNIDSIMRTGINKGQRHHVHLSATRETALQVGGRHGKPVLILINAERMHQDGYTFFLSTNGVWLTHEVPTRYLLGIEG